MEASQSSLLRCDCRLPSDTGSGQACCDSTCIEVAAQQECDAQCNVSETSNKDLKDISTPTASGSCSSQTQPSDPGQKKACNKHLKAAHGRYAPTLAAIGCICKALVQLNLQSCCSSIQNRARRHSRDAALRRKSAVSSTRGTRSTDTIKTARSSGVECWKKTAGCESMANTCGKQTDVCGEKVGCCGATPDACDKNFTGSPSTLSRAAYNEKSCCKESSGVCAKTTFDDASGSSLQDPCCGKTERQGEDSGVGLNITASSSCDIEKGTAITEHVILNVEGLTCVGCENKLFRSLNAIPGIHNIQTSLVMSQAGFDVNLDAGSISNIIREVAKTTGFTCGRVNTRGHGLDVFVTGEVGKFINQERPYGVESMVALDKQTVRVLYDANLVGARDLLKKFDAAITLAPPRPYAELETGSKHVRKTAYMTAFSAVLTIPVLILAWSPLPRHEIIYGALSLTLATIVQIAVAGPFYSSALRALLFTRVIEMDLLIVLSTSTAYIFSIIAFANQIQGHPLSTGEFFQTSTLLVTLIMFGRLVSAFARHKAVESISIRSLQTETALLVENDGRGARTIDARLFQYGDIFKVSPDTRVATDGIVVSGESEVDESNVTGEAVPVEKSTGSHVIAGSVNGSGTMTIRLTRLPDENTLSGIAAMVDAAKFSKPKIQALADRVASYFVPVIVLLTLITFCIWIGVGIAIQHQPDGSAAVNAMTYAISVLIVSCPCAIGLAVPMVIVIAGDVGAKHGVVFKSAETIEIARKLSHVVFDKTGTLTEGKLSVAAEEYLLESRKAAASLALGLTVNSKHPVSAAVAAHLQAQGVEPAIIENLKSVTGNGMEGIWNGASVRGGHSRWLAVQTEPPVTLLLSQGRTVFCVSLGEDLLVIYGLDDSLRPDAKPVVSELQKRGIAISVVSGDDDGAVQETARQLEIPASHIRSRCSPADKQKYIEALMAHKSQTVLFCGDGTNDAVALAQAHIGLHMASGTDVAQSAADAVLVRPALSGILVLIDLSRAVFRRIVINFAWSFVYNMVAVLLAAGAFVHARIPPQYAGLGELVSVLPVILIAVQLRWFRCG